MKTNHDSSLAGKVILGLQSAAVELEEFRLQLALGRMEARDLFQNSKKRFRSELRDAVRQIRRGQWPDTDQYLRFLSLADRLEIQLALGIADSRQAFEDQRKRLNALVSDLEQMLRTNPKLDEVMTRLLLQAGKLRIQLEILSLKFELKKTEARLEYGNQLRVALKAINKIGERIMETRSRVQHAGDEIRQAYVHLRKAFGRV